MMAREKTHASLKPFQNYLVLFLGIGTLAIFLGFLFAINMLLQCLLFGTSQGNETLMMCLASIFEPEFDSLVEPKPDFHLAGCLMFFLVFRCGTISAFKRFTR